MSRNAQRAALLILAGAIGGLTDGRAQAQVSVAKPGGLPSSGVLHPSKQVDPGMSRPVPHLPSQSTPVIHPKATRRNGTVVVPR